MTSSSPSRNKQSGFTIVELLIVIVIIAILATITIIAFNGVRSRASDSALKSDLSTSAKLLANDLTTTGQYPASTSAANSGKGLPSSNGTTYTYVPDNISNPKSYTLTATSPSATGTYRVSSVNNAPVLIVATLPVITTPNTATDYSTAGCGPGPAYYTFSINSIGTGSPTPTIQWQRMTPKNTMSGTWVDISGATSAYLTYDASGVMSTDDYGLFRARYTNPAGTAISPAYRVFITTDC